MAGLITSAAVISGELIFGMDDGSLLRAGYVQGPQGLQGERGPIGSTGRAGEDGNTIHHGAGTARGDLGKDGDFYIDTVEWTIRLKENGTWNRPQPLLVPAKSRTGEFGEDRRTNGGPGRFFPMGGVSSSVSTTPATTGGLEKIIGNGNPLGANVWSPIALDADGDLMEATLYFKRAGGSEVYVTKIVCFRANTVGDLTIAWEAANPSTMSHTVEFDAPVNGTELILRVRSNTNWEEIRGSVNKL